MLCAGFTYEYDGYEGEDHDGVTLLRCVFGLFSPRHRLEDVGLLLLQVQKGIDLDVFLGDILS
jgi:hypothetical protein